MGLAGANLALGVGAGVGIGGDQGIGLTHSGILSVFIVVLFIQSMARALWLQSQYEPRVMSSAAKCLHNAEMLLSKTLLFRHF